MNHAPEVGRQISAIARVGQIVPGAEKQNQGRRDSGNVVGRRFRAAVVFDIFSICTERSEAVKLAYSRSTSTELRVEMGLSETCQSYFKWK